MPVVMGTAGHIDHGKTSLVRALTGIDCDRLAEEKRRGITIELGFAHLDFPGGRRLSIVDVPGHERFVKTMVAGATGTDFVLLVIAADEGVMPQTREHLEICSLLRIPAGLVALTKIDAVDPELLDMALEDIRAELAGTFLEDAPVFPVSSRTGEGIPALRKALDSIEQSLSAPRRLDLFRLPVDRVFSMKGHGTVVTGTMTSGRLRLGEEVELLPSGRRSKARSLQSHGESVELAPAGRRTAVNIQGIEMDAVERGDVLALPGTFFPSLHWEARVTCLPSSPRPLRHRGELHLHHGSREIMARVFLRDCDKLAPGQSALAQIRFTRPLPALFGDHFVLRSFSPLRTVAGGVVLHPLGLDLRRKDSLRDEKLAQLAALEDADEETRLLSQLYLAGRGGCTFAELRVLCALDAGRLEKLLGLFGGRQQAFCVDREEKRYLGAPALEALEQSCLAHLQAFHEANSLKQGISRAALGSGWGRTLQPKPVHFLLERMVKAGNIRVEADGIRLAGHSITLASGQDALRAALLGCYAAAGAEPPSFKDALASIGGTEKEVTPVLRLLLAEHSLIKVADGLYYHHTPLVELEAKIRDWFTAQPQLDPGSFKELTGLSRKYAIPLLEYFDAIRLTMRSGNVRVLRSKLR